MAKPILVIDGKKHKVVPPYEGASYANVPDIVCPHCGKDLQVQGTGKRISGHDTYVAGAVCTACDKLVGELRLKVSTIFGLEEDEAVFRLGVKIY